MIYSNFKFPSSQYPLFVHYLYVYLVLVLIQLLSTPRALAVPPSSLVPAFIQISLCAPPQLTITRIVHNKSNACFPHSGLGFKSTRNGFLTGSDPHLAMMISVRGRSLLSVRAFSIFRNMS